MVVMKMEKFFDCHGKWWNALCTILPMWRSFVEPLMITCMCVSYLTVVSALNIATQCVMEQRVAMTVCDPTTELIFRHAGSVELVTRRKFQKQHALAKERKLRPEANLQSSRWRRNTHIKGSSQACTHHKLVCLILLSICTVWQVSKL